MHSASCHVPRPDTQEMKGVSWDGVLALRRGEKHSEKETNGATQITHRGKKRICRMHFAHPECGSEHRITRERKLSILPVHERSLANGIDFIQLCEKYVCGIAESRNYTESC